MGWGRAGGNSGRVVRDCTEPLQPQRCAGVGIVGGGGGGGREVRGGLMWGDHPSNNSTKQIL